jgi:hypothetical protein
MFGKLLLASTVTASAVALATSSAFAATMTGATVSGNIKQYCVSGNTTVECPAANPQSVLDGGGNIELAADTEITNSYGTLSTLTGDLDGRAITFSSLTAADWGFGNPTGLAYTWFNDALAANGVSLTAQEQSAVFSIFSANGGFQRTSDPNVMAVSRDTYGTGDVSFGLAGHLNLNQILLDAINAMPTGMAKTVALMTYNTKIGDKVLHASEVVKVTYDGQTKFLYGFNPTNSGLVAANDGYSHNANYQLTFDADPDTPTEDIPEPSLLLGLASLGGATVLKRKRATKA